MREVYIVVDVEASGPTPGQYALLSIGACTVEDLRQTFPPYKGKRSGTFYVELQPDRDAFTREAMSVNQLSLDRLTAEGLPPADAMQKFADWVKGVVPEDARPVFTAFNAPFDWMFVNEYFYRYLGHNPFGHAALDIKAYYMGLHGVPWEETSYQEISNRYLEKHRLSHHALDDAIDEAEIVQALLIRRESDGERHKSTE